MLSPRPDQRAGLDDICRHPWFLKDLPPGALAMNDWYMNHADSLQDRLELVQAIVEAAATAGHAAEPLLQCYF
jgi:hypothetical protein